MLECRLSNAKLRAHFVVAAQRGLDRDLSENRLTAKNLLREKLPPELTKIGIFNHFK